MTDRPTATELINAVKGFLEHETLPALMDARLRYSLLIAIRLLDIVGQELPIEEEHLGQDWEMLQGVLGPCAQKPTSLSGLREAVLADNERLCAKIRAGEFDEPGRFSGLATELRQMVVRKRGGRGTSPGQSRRG